MNNGHTSSFFTPSRGIRQGCPISANIFILVAEVLAHTIRVNKDIKGITINNIEFKLSQYADDTCLFMSGVDSLREALVVFEKFSNCSGLKVNKEKSEAIWIGASSNYRPKPLGLKWTLGATYLGVYISNNIKETINTNFQNRIQKIKDILNMWILRKLTIIGKIQVVNTLIISQLLYAATVMHMPKVYIDEYNLLIKKFIWNGKPPKVKYTSLINTVEEGGLKLQDLECKLKAVKIKWIKNIGDPDTISPWKSYMSQSANLDISLLPAFNLNGNDYPTFKDQFHNDLLNAWAAIHFFTPVNAKQVGIQPLWHNSLIKIANKPAWYPNWQISGINYIQDMLNDKGSILTKEQLEIKYGLTCKGLQYNSIASAIPTEWKIMLKNSPICNLNIPVGGDIIVNMQGNRKKFDEVSTKDVYLHLVSILCQRPTSENKWGEKLTFEVTEEMWKLIYTNALNVTQDTSVRTLQYKITHRIIACNYNLKIWKIKTSDQCNFCDKQDTIEHFFYECNTTYTFWQHIFNWWATNIKIWFSIDTYEIIFGIPNERDEAIVNQLKKIILYGKYYIYGSKKKETELNLYEFLMELRKQLKSKHEIMTSNCSENKFQQLWGDLYNCLF
jgi:hypothetical protein